MTVFLTLLVIGVLALVVAVALGRIGGGLPPPTSSLPGTGRLDGDGTVTSADLAALRFSPAVRGYRMEEVDEVLDRLGEELDRRDGELHRLRSGLGPSLPVETGSERAERAQVERAQVERAQVERAQADG